MGEGGAGDNCLPAAWEVTWYSGSRRLSRSVLHQGPGICGKARHFLHSFISVQLPAVEQSDGRYLMLLHFLSLENLALLVENCLLSQESSGRSQGGWVCENVRLGCEESGDKSFALKYMHRNEHTLSEHS